MTDDTAIVREALEYCRRDQVYHPAIAALDRLATLRQTALDLSRVPPGYQFQALELWRTPPGTFWVALAVPRAPHGPYISGIGPTPKAALDEAIDEANRRGAKP